MVPSGKFADTTLWEALFQGYIKPLYQVVGSHPSTIGFEYWNEPAGLPNSPGPLITLHNYYEYEAQRLRTLSSTIAVVFQANPGTVDNADSASIITAIAPTTDLKPYVFEGHMYSYDSGTLVAWGQGAQMAGAYGFIGETHDTDVPFYTTVHSLGFATEYYRWSCDSLLGSNCQPTSTALTLSTVYNLIWGSMTTVSCVKASVTVGTTSACKATVSGFRPTGIVAWSSGSTGKFSSASCKLSKHKTYSTCSVKFTPTAAGSVTLTANYGGDSKNSASAGTHDLTVTMKATKILVSCSPRSVVAGSSKAITCKAKVIGYLPTGTVSWSQIGTGSVSLSSTTCALTSSKNHNRATCSVTMTGTTASKVTIQATYSADPNNQGSLRTAALTIKP
ncbi:MAG: hypothetical protein ABSB29_01590 [Nitrososphaerales archaeon]